MGIALITTRTKTHLLAPDAVPTRLVPAFQPFDQRARTACGITVDGLSGEHVAGYLPGSINCRNCHGTLAFREAADQQWLAEHRPDILAATVYVQTKFYPPLPAEYGELAVRALAAVNEGDPYAEFEVTHLPIIPREVNAEGKVTAARLVQSLRLGHLVDEGADDIAYLEV